MISIIFHLLKGSVCRQPEIRADQIGRFKVQKRPEMMFEITSGLEVPGNGFSPVSMKRSTQPKDQMSSSGLELVSLPVRTSGAR